MRRAGAASDGAALPTGRGPDWTGLDVASTGHLRNWFDRCKDVSETLLREDLGRQIRVQPMVAVFVFAKGWGQAQ